MSVLPILFKEGWTIIEETTGRSTLFAVGAYTRWDFLDALKTVGVFFAVLLTTSAILRAWRRRPPEVESGSPKLQLPPGSLGLPFLGEMLQFIYQSSTSDFFQRRIASFGPIFKTHILFKPTVFVAGPDPVRKVLLGEDHLVETSWPAAMRRLLGPGALATAKGPAHKARRQAIARSLGGEFLAGCLPRMRAVVEAELDRWARASPSEPVEVYGCARRMTIRVASEVMLGVKAHDLHEFNRCIIEYADGFFALPINLPGAAYHRAVKAKSKLHEIIALSLKTGSAMEAEDTNGLIGHILADKKTSRDVSSVDHVIDQALEMLFGGQETLSAFVTCFVLLLSKNADVIDELSRELRANDLLLRAADDGEDRLSLTSLAELKYVDYVIKEVLRLYPPIGGGYRKVIKDFDVQGYRIPMDWAITYSIKATHDLSPLFAEDRDAFRPDRWSTLVSSSSSSSDHSGISGGGGGVCPVRLQDHFLPFGAGARACVGRRYAVLFMRLFCVLLVGRMAGWSLAVPDPVMLSVPIVRPKNGLFVRFRVR